MAVVPIGQIGPNAIIQLVHAIDAHEGRAVTRDIFAASGCTAYLDTAPESMVDEHDVAALHQALFRALPGAHAQAVARDAGGRTADYVIANRIPRLAKMVLGVLPPAFAARFLLRAISRHAWTFAGSGGFSANSQMIQIASNPIAVPGCPWHQAVFERLFQRLVCHDATVRETTCCARGDAACRFELSLVH
ncbi:MAG: bacteriochlorophyll 4-vinyl reductase [Pseudomonadota bacterium]